MPRWRKPWAFFSVFQMPMLSCTISAFHPHHTYNMHHLRKKLCSCGGCSIWKIGIPSHAHSILWQATGWLLKNDMRTGLRKSFKNKTEHQMLELFDALDSDEPRELVNYYRWKEVWACCVCLTQHGALIAALNTTWRTHCCVDGLNARQMVSLLHLSKWRQSQQKQAPCVALNVLALNCRPLLSW